MNLRILYFYSVMLLHTCISHDFGGFAHFDDHHHLYFQESEEEVTDTEQAENWFSLTSAQRICGMSAGILVNSCFPPWI